MWHKLIILLFFTSSLVAQKSEEKFSIYFENDAYALTQDHLKYLDSLKNKFSRDSIQLSIKGYTNDIATSDYNLKLSARRANRVKEEFKDFNVIDVAGYGEIASDAAVNRRVDIIILNPEPMEDKASEPDPSKINDLSQIEAGDKIKLEGIHFYPGRDDIKNESWPALRELLKYLKQHNDITFRIVGHVCCGKKDQPTQDGRNNRTGRDNLSEDRAKRIYSYLSKNGIDSKRMNYRGDAFRYPTGKGSSFDRRVEIEIISVN